MRLPTKASQREQFKNIPKYKLTDDRSSDYYYAQKRKNARSKHYGGFGNSGFWNTLSEWGAYTAGQLEDILDTVGVNVSNEGTRYVDFVDNRSYPKYEGGQLDDGTIYDARPDETSGQTVDQIEENDFITREAVDASAQALQGDTFARDFFSSQNVDYFSVLNDYDSKFSQPSVVHSLFLSNQSKNFNQSSTRDRGVAGVLGK